MLRAATSTDVSSIAERLWTIRSHYQARQIPTNLTRLKRETLLHEIKSNIGQWLVYESPDPAESGFLELSAKPEMLKPFFPDSIVHVQQFASLKPGEVLVKHFQALASYFPSQSISLSFPVGLREAYWAALKVGFRRLGGDPTANDAFLWVYLDRDGTFERVEKKLIRAQVVERHIT